MWGALHTRCVKLTLIPSVCGRLCSAQNSGWELQINADVEMCSSAKLPQCQHMHTRAPVNCNANWMLSSIPFHSYCLCCFRLLPSSLLLLTSNPILRVRRNQAHHCSDQQGDSADACTGRPLLSCQRPCAEDVPTKLHYEHLHDRQSLRD